MQRALRSPGLLASLALLSLTGCVAHPRGPHGPSCAAIEAAAKIDLSSHRLIVLRNIAGVARGRPVVIQSLFFRIDGRVPPDHELRAYCDNLGHLLHGGARIKLVQVHTIARPPAAGKCMFWFSST